MGTDRLNVSAVQDHNLIGMHNGGDPLGDDDFCGTFQISRKSLADSGLGGGVYGAGGVIQNQDLRMTKQRTGNAEALLLTAGETGTALPQLSFIAMGQIPDEFVHAGNGTGLFDFFR